MIAQQDDAEPDPLLAHLAREDRGPLFFRPVRLGGVGRPHHQRDVALLQALFDFGDEVFVLLDVDFAEPGSEAGADESGREFFDEGLVPGAVGEEDLHRVFGWTSGWTSGGLCHDRGSVAESSWQAAGKMERADSSGLKPLGMTT